MPEPRPTSPFLVLLLGAAATVLAAEWLRFGWSLAPAVAVAVAGGTATVAGVARAFRRRRRWRRRAKARRAAEAAPAAAPGEAGPAEEAEGPRIHRSVADPVRSAPIPREAGAGAAVLPPDPVHR